MHILVSCAMSEGEKPPAARETSETAPEEKEAEKTVAVGAEVS